MNLSSAHHPQTYGQTERVNQILEQYLLVYSQLPTRRLGGFPFHGGICPPHFGFTMFSMSLSSNSTILLAFRDDKPFLRRPWNYRQGKGMRLTGSSTKTSILGLMERLPSFGRHMGTSYTFTRCVGGNSRFSSTIP